jgi:TP901 family phage tail tape measure protein
MADNTINVFINLSSNIDGKLKATTNQLDRFSRDANRKIGRASKSFLGLGAAVKGAGARVLAFTRRWTALATTLGTTAVVFKSLSDAQKFGIAIAEIGTIFDDTDAQLRMVEKTVLELSEALGLPETIAAKGFYQIISSDITDAAEAMVVLKEGTELATVGLADVKQTVDVLTSVIKAYQTDVSESARITEILFKTVVKGKTTIPELATSLGQVLPIAAQLGVSLEEVTAAIATLTQGGIDTNVAVIQLRQAFNQILKPSAEAAEVLAKYNINVSAARVRTTGFRDVLVELQTKIGDNTADLSKIFGNIRALIPVLALTGKQAEQFARNLRFIGEESNVADDALRKFLDNPFKRFQRFFNALRIRLREVGETFIKELDRQLDAAGFDATVNNIDALFGGLKGAAEGAARAVGGLFTQISDFVRRLGGLERAEEIITNLGKVIASAVNVAFQTAISLVLTFVEVVARLPAIVRALQNEFRDTFSFLPGVEAAQDTKDEIRAEFQDVLDIFDTLTERRRMFEREAEAAGRRLFPFLGFQETRDISDAFTRALTIETARTGSLGAVDQAIADLTGQVNSINQAIEDAPPSIDSVASSFEGLASRLGRTQLAIAETHGFWDDFSRALLRPLPQEVGPASFREFFDGIRSGFEELAEFAGVAAARVASTFASSILLPTTTINLDVLKAQSRKALLEAFADDVGIEFPLVARLDADATVRGFNRDAERIRKAIEASLGLVLPELDFLDTEGLDSAFKNAVELTDIEAGLLDGIEGSLAEQVRLLDRTAGLRESEFRTAIAQLGVDEKRRKVLLELFAEFERAGRANVLGFGGQDEALERINRGLASSLDRQRSRLEATNAELRESAMLWREFGLIDDDQLEEQLRAIERTVRQFNEKIREQALGQEGFEILTPTSRLFESIENQAKLAAIAASNLEGGIADTAVEAARLRFEFNDAMRELTEGGDAFITGFKSGLLEIADALNDDLTRGIQSATDAVEGFRSSFSSALSDFIAGTSSSSEALEAFREAFAQSLADTLATTLTDTLTSTLLDIVTSAFEEGATSGLAEAAARGAAQFGGGILAPVGAAAAVGTEVAAGAVSESAELLAAFAPAVAGLETAALAIGSSATASATSLTTSASLLNSSGGLLSGAAAALNAAAAAIVAASTVGGATGGIFTTGTKAATAIQPFAMGGVPRGGFERLQAGGVKIKRTFAEIAEAGIPEAVVPLPGNNRAIPVEFKDPGAVARGGRGGGAGGSPIVIQASIGFSFNNLDPRGTREAVLSQAPSLMKALSSSLESGANREFELAVRRAANGA